MGAHVTALVVDEFVIEGENVPVGVDRGAHFVALLARMIGRDQVLAPILDPFNRPPQAQRRETDQHVLWIKLAANAKAAADVPLEQMHARGGAPKHARDAVAIPVRHLGRAVKLEHVAGDVVASNGATRLDRHAGMPPDCKLELDHGMRRAERGIQVAVRSFQDGCLGRMPIGELAGWRRSVEDDRQFRDLNFDRVGSILGQVRVAREYRRNRLADIAHALLGKNGLAIRRQALDAGEAKIDRRNFCHVLAGPHRHNSRKSLCRFGLDRDDAAVGMRRAHHAHVQQMRKSDVGGERSPARHQRPVLQARNRASDEAHLNPHVRAAARSAAQMRCGVAGSSSMETPNGASASLMALMTAAGAPTAPPSPNPFALVMEADVSVSR